jgi:hypothetical protein
MRDGMRSDRRFLLPLCAAVTEGDKTGDVIRLSQDGYVDPFGRELMQDVHRLNGQIHQ